MARLLEIYFSEFFIYVSCRISLGGIWDFFSDSEAKRGFSSICPRHNSLNVTPNLIYRPKIIVLPHLQFHPQSQIKKICFKFQFN